MTHVLRAVRIHTTHTHTHAREKACAQSSVQTHAHKHTHTHTHTHTCACSRVLVCVCMFLPSLPALCCLHTASGFVRAITIGPANGQARTSGQIRGLPSLSFSSLHQPPACALSLHTYTQHTHTHTCTHMHTHTHTHTYRVLVGGQECCPVATEEPRMVQSRMRL